MKRLLKFVVILSLIFIFTGCDNKYSSKYEVSEDFKNGFKEYKNLDYDEYKEKLDNKETFVVLLWQTGCSHCESFEPKLNELISNLKLKVYGLNTALLSDEEYAIVKNKTFISGTPTTVYFKEGKFEDSLVGDKSIDSVLSFFKQNNIIKEK